MRSRRPWAARRARPARVATGSSADHHGASPTTPTTDGSSAAWTATRAPIEWPRSTTGTSPCAARIRSSAHRASATGPVAAVPAALAVARQPDADAGLVGPRRDRCAAATRRGATTRCARRRPGRAGLAAVEDQDHRSRAAGGVVRRQVRVGHASPSERGERRMGLVGGCTEGGPPSPEILPRTWWGGRQWTPTPSGADSVASSSCLTSRKIHTIDRGGDHHQRAHEERHRGALGERRRARRAGPSGRGVELPGRRAAIGGRDLVGPASARSGATRC